MPNTLASDGVGGSRRMCIEIVPGLGKCAGGGGLENWGDEFSVNGEDGETSSNLFLKMLMNRAVTTEVGSLFQYFTTLTEMADPLL